MRPLRLMLPALLLAGPAAASTSGAAAATPVAPLLALAAGAAALVALLGRRPEPRRVPIRVRSRDPRDRRG